MGCWFIQYFFGGVRQGKFFSFTVNHLFDSDIFFSNWQLLNPIPIFNFFQQLAVAEPDSDFRFFQQLAVAEPDSEPDSDLFFQQRGSCRNRHRVFCSPNSATVAVVVAETDFFSLKIFRHSTAISPKRKLVGLLFE